MTINVAPILDLNAYDALFVDIDGTAVDSEPVIRKIINQMSADAGYVLSPKAWDELGGLGDKGVWAKICEWFPDFSKSYENGDVFEYARLEQYAKRIDEVQAHPSVKRLVNLFIDQAKDTGAVTNSKPEIAVRHLEGTGYPLDKMFLLTEFDAHSRGLKSKPEPALYHMAYHKTASNRLDRGLVSNFKKAGCLVLEDSPNGARAGLRAGHTVIQLIDLAKPLGMEEVRSFTARHRSKYHAMTFGNFDALVTAAERQTQFASVRVA